MYIDILFTFLIFSHVHSIDLRVDPLVLTDQGLVRGQQSTDGEYTTFLGIPYAQVNLENPFGPSQPHPGFGDEVFNAYDGSAACAQVGEYNALPATRSKRSTKPNYILDCLQLNIFVPNSASVNNPLPVFVWIHGGSYSGGNALDEGIPYVIKHDIIGVVINYRLGPYGFLCLDTPLASGNQGLKDQLQALRWIKRNIAAFGGNSNNITIGGMSAGGASILYHLYSDKENLFNKVISSSGVPDCDGLFVKGDKDAAIKLANHIGFNTTDTEESLAVLSQIDPSIVSNAFKDLDLRLMPCKEKQFDGIESFIEEDLYLFSSSDKIKNTPILIGHTDKEVFGPIFSVYGHLSYMSNPFKCRIERNFHFNEEMLENNINLVRWFYIADSAISEEMSNELEQFDSDFVFNHSIHRTIGNLLKENGGPVYQYLFKYNGTFGNLHYDDVNYLFQSPSNKEVVLNVEDLLTRERMISLWSNFIKFGNPTPAESDLVPFIWEPSTLNERPYLIIDNDLSMSNRVYNKRMTFWDLFYSAYEDNRNKC